VGVVLAGVAVRTDQVRLLVRLLNGDELAAKLARGVQNRNDIVGLSGRDRQRIIDVLTEPPPSGLAELRNVLVTQLKLASDREVRAERNRELQRMRAAREARRD
jgi:hypothetical protein